MQKTSIFRVHQKHQCSSRSFDFPKTGEPRAQKVCAIPVSRYVRLAIPWKHASSTSYRHQLEHSELPHFQGLGDVGFGV